MWDVEQRSIFAILTGHGGDIYGIDFDPSGRHVASYSSDRTIRIWDIETRQQSGLILANHVILKIVFSPDAKFVFGASLDRAVHVWDVLRGLIIRIDGHQDSIYDIRLLPNECFLTASFDKTLKLWEPVRANPAGGLTSSVRMTMKGHKVLVMYEGCDRDEPLTNDHRTLFLQPP